MRVRLYFEYQGQRRERWFEVTPPAHIAKNFEQQEAYLTEWGRKTTQAWFKEETGEEPPDEFHVSVQ